MHHAHQQNSSLRPADSSRVDGAPKSFTLGWNKHHVWNRGRYYGERRRVRDALPAMIEAQSHRGPDDQVAHYVRFGAAYLGLGHRRLSILDLSPSGHEPMAHPLTGDQLIYNGEIYNFKELRRKLELRGVRFQGHCDAEVLLHALTEWGSDAICRLQGMFAFAFFDAAPTASSAGP